MMAYAKIKGMRIFLWVYSEEYKQYCDVLDRESHSYTKVMSGCANFISADEGKYYFHRFTQEVQVFHLSSIFKPFSCNLANFCLQQTDENSWVFSFLQFWEE